MKSFDITVSDDLSLLATALHSKQEGSFVDYTYLPYAVGM